MPVPVQGQGNQGPKGIGDDRGHIVKKPRELVTHWLFQNIVHKGNEVFGRLEESRKGVVRFLPELREAGNNASGRNPEFLLPHTDFNNTTDSEFRRGLTLFHASEALSRKKMNPVRCRFSPE